LSLGLARHLLIQNSLIFLLLLIYFALSYIRVALIVLPIGGFYKAFSRPYIYFEFAMLSFPDLFAAVWTSPTLYRCYEKELNTLHAAWEASRKYHREQMQACITTLTLAGIIYVGPASANDSNGRKAPYLFTGCGLDKSNRAKVTYPTIRVCAELRQWREAIYAIEYILFAKNALKTLYRRSIFMKERYHQAFDLMVEDIRKLGPPPSLVPATPRLDDVECVFMTPPVFFDAPNISALIDALDPEKRAHMDVQVNAARATVKRCPSFFLY